MSYDDENSNGNNEDKDTRPNVNLLHMIWDEIKRNRDELKALRDEVRNLRKEQRVNTKKIKDDIDNRFNAFDIAMELLQSQYQSTGEEIGSIRENCVKRGVAMTRLAKTMGTPIPKEL